MRLRANLVIFSFSGPCWHLDFKGDRGTKSKLVPGTHQVYGFLTAAPCGAVSKAAGYDLERFGETDPGVDGTSDSWAVVIDKGHQTIIRDDAEVFDIVAIDVPIGLLDAYETGGRACDRAARKFLGRPRGSSVFPAP